MSLRKNTLSRLLALLLCATALWSCGDSESFTIEGTVDGNATINLRFIYYSNNTLIKGLTAARDGKFEYKGSVSAPTIVEILDNDYRPLGRLYVANGERIECSLTRNAPNALQVSGSEVSSRWAKFLNDNAEALASDKANEVIASYVSSHSDDIVSTLLMLTSYDASSDAMTADSLMSAISPEVKPSGIVDGYNAMLQRLVSGGADEKVARLTCLNMRDSIVSVGVESRPLTLISLSEGGTQRSETIVPALRRLSRKSLRPSVDIIDISLDRDTVAWHKNVRGDSAVWRQLWLAGSLASPGIDRLAVPRLPYFIVADSAGSQLLRTASMACAEKYIDSIITATKH